MLPVLLYCKTPNISAPPLSIERAVFSFLSSDINNICRGKAKEKNNT